MARLVYKFDRCVSVLVLFLFFVWIIPLGAFIDPSKEDKACGGQRAICLCSLHLEKNQNRNHAPKIAITNPGVNKESRPAGGASHDFLLSKRDLLKNSSNSFYLIDDIFSYQFSALRVVEHIPKT